jgi:hypothetical protein
MTPAYPEPMHACPARPVRTAGLPRDTRAMVRNRRPPRRALLVPAAQRTGVCGPMMSAACRSARAIRSRGLTFRSSSASSGTSSRNGVRSSTPGSPRAFATRPCGASWAASVSAGTWLPCCPAGAEVPCRLGGYPAAVPMPAAGRPGSAAWSAAAPASPARAGGRSPVARRVRVSRCLRPAQVLRPFAVMTMRWRR